MNRHFEKGFRKALRESLQIIENALNESYFPQERLWFAVLRDDIDGLRQLLDKEHVDPNFADPFNPDYKVTPLMKAVQIDGAAVESLLKAGADPNAADKFGWTPLMYAATAKASSEVITMLVKAGANIDAVNARHQTPLMLATMCKDGSGVENLLQSGADPDIADETGESPLSFAEKMGWEGSPTWEKLTANR